MSSQYQLLRERRFLPLFCIQYLGALNDNVYKQALVVLLSYASFTQTALSIDADTLQNLAVALFTLPYFLISATAGQIADKFEKSKLMSWIIAFEALCMALGGWGMLQGSLEIMLFALFLGGIQSALFAPVKLAILPQHLKDEELVGGNGMIELAISIAVLMGMIFGVWLVSNDGWGIQAVLPICVSLSGVAWLVSRQIPKAPAADPALKINWNLYTETRDNFRFMRGNRTVFLSVLGISWFWFYASIIVTQFPNLAKEVLGGQESVITTLLVTLSLGIGLGSLLCERLSGGKVELGLVPFGSIGMTLFAIDFYFAVPGTSSTVQAPVGASAFLAESRHWRLLGDLFFMGVFSGFFIVPLNALIQQRCEPSHRSRVIAGNNIINAAFMLVAAALAVGLFALGFDIPELVLITGLLNAVVAIYIYTLVPEFLLRFIVWMLIHSVYRLDARGLQHIPEEGPALLVCNHVSYVDALVIMAASRRPIRFVMDHRIFKIPVLNFVFREGRAIAIAQAKEDPVMLEAAYEEVARALAAGELVGLFPEGRLTETGELNTFRSGMRRILDTSPVPVVPMALQGLWGSFFSRVTQGAAFRRLRGLWSRIGLHVAPPLAPELVTPEGVQALIGELRGERR